MRSIHKYCLPLLCSLMTACAPLGVSSQSDTKPAVPDNILTNTSISQLTQYVRGRLVDDKGNPLARATVYFPNLQPRGNKPLSSYQLGSISIESGACQKPKLPFYSFTCTDTNGNFHLHLLGSASQPLRLAFDYLQQEMSIALSINDMSTDLGSITLRKSELERTKIAIVMDLFNPFEPIARQLDQSNPLLMHQELTHRFFKHYQLNEYEYEVFFPSLSSLFQDSNSDGKADIHLYKSIYLNSRGEEDMQKLSKKQKAVLLEFVSNGGELLITNWGAQSPLPDEFI